MRMLLVFSMATGHVFVSTASTIAYIMEACTIGLNREGLKLLVGVWINHLYIQQHIKKAKGMYGHECFLTPMFALYLCILFTLGTLVSYIY